MSLPSNVDVAIIDSTVNGIAGLAYLGSSKRTTGKTSPPIYKDKDKPLPKSFK